MKKIVSVVACVTVAVMAAGIARGEDCAAPGKPEGKRPRKGPDFFVKADADKDGKLSLAEFVAAAKTEAEAKFAAADADKDGFLTPEELKAGRPMRKPLKIKDADVKPDVKPVEAPAAK